MPKSKKTLTPEVDGGGGIRNRVTEIRKLRLGDLSPYPLNWRQHPDTQRGALRGVLDELGWAGVVFAYQPEPDGPLVCLDGHLRREEQPDLVVDVAVLDLSPQEAAYFVATHDPLAALAEANREALDGLLREFNSGSAAVQGMLSDLAVSAGVIPLEDGVAGDNPGGGDDLADTQLVVGGYRCAIDRAEYLRWEEEIRAEVGFERPDIMFEIKRRLGLCS
jgi:hypothetical protein